jgi:hypothetical protein
MPFRDTLKRVFHRSSSSKDLKNGKPKVEYYRRHEIPPSKFRGPFDKEHQKRLAAWSFDGAMAERPRSFDDYSLSPCATYDLPDGPLGPLDPLDRDVTGDISPDDHGVPIDPGMYLKSIITPPPHNKIRVMEKLLSHFLYGSNHFSFFILLLSSPIYPKQ